MAAAENTPTAKYGKLLMLALPTSSNFMPLVSRISSLQSFGLLVSSAFIRPIPSLFSSFPSCECLLPFPPIKNSHWRPVSGLRTVDTEPKNPKLILVYCLPNTNYWLLP